MEAFVVAGTGQALLLKVRIIAINTLTFAVRIKAFLALSTEMGADVTIVAVAVLASRADGSVQYLALSASAA